MEENIQRPQFTFYRSYWEAIENLPKKDRLLAYEAVVDYALNGTEPQLSELLAYMPYDKDAHEWIKPYLTSPGKARQMAGQQCRVERIEI